MFCILIMVCCCCCDIVNYLQFIGNRATITDTVSRLAALPSHLAAGAPGAREYILAFVTLANDVSVAFSLFCISNAGRYGTSIN